MTKKAELVFIPLPGMGHLVPTVQLAKLLVHLNSNLSITIITIKPPYDAKVCAYVDSLSADRTPSTISPIKFINLPQPDPDIDFFKFMSSLVEIQGPLVKDAVTNLVEICNSVPDTPRLTGFVLDMFLTPFVELANEFGVPSYVFYTSGAAFLGFKFYAQALHDEQNLDLLELKESETEFTVPSYVNPVPTKLFPFIRGRSETVTFFLDLARRLRENHDTIMQWLDEQPSSSVVFLCFGSMGSFSVEQVTEIANALEQGGHSFLWSLRRSGEQVKGIEGSPTDYESMTELLPEGFLDRTAEIGKVIGWAPQVAILSHPATGGFISHCGWNSILESIWFGVPMMVWPLYAEQHMNAFSLGTAIDLKMDYKNYGDEAEIVKADKIERRIRWLMEQDNNIRKRMKEMSDKSRQTLTNGGTSHFTQCCFIHDIMDNLS
ncbi:Pectinesterase [Hibiscus syriacus]|uniref:Glycosyltransferase n=1 Tax=Hibiscus syriacus TaxID=106335 RepID=A0A6A2Z269_HIBSY|nr:Pectinesterase [Hibiscus syriacus]